MKNFVRLIPVSLLLIVSACTSAVPVSIDENAKANALFEAVFQEQVALSPTFQTRLGLKTNYDKWDDISDAASERELALTKRQLSDLESKIDYAALTGQTKLSYELAKKSMEQEIANYKWRYHNYPVNQMFGWQSNVPSFLINMHRVSSVEDAEAYISRLNGVAPMFTELVAQLQKREALGVVAPSFVHPKVIDDSQNVISGAPFDDSEDSPLFADLKSKVNALEIDEAEKSRLIAEGAAALLGSVKPAYLSLIDFMSGQHKRATTDAGAWKFPDGDAFYKIALAHTTTTDLSASQIHDLGLSEVARIHQEMRAIMQEVGFSGDLQAFFKHVDDDQFYLPNTEEGRAEFLARSNKSIADMKARLDEFFNVQPKAGLIVKAVEPFREKSAGTAFYQSPALDGSRPGIYYVNLYNPTSTPTYEIDALAYHEGLPGHHMQLAIAQELEGIPKFRKFGRYTAYTEGWGLYSEFLPLEYGFYADPYSNFGRLTMELWRAIRLVVDTGLHEKKWTREQAIQYILDNSPTEQADAAKAIERYIVLPSQATAYKIGMLKILELRQKAKDALGADFDIREFHDVVLKNGAVPLDVLETLVGDYIAENS